MEEHENKIIRKYPLCRGRKIHKERLAKQHDLKCSLKKQPGNQLNALMRHHICS